MTIHRAALLEIAPLHCTECILSSNDQLCRPAVRAIVNAAVAHNPTIDIPARDPERTEVAARLLDSMLYQTVARDAGTAACKSYQQFHNQTATESPLTIMI